MEEPVPIERDMGQDDEHEDKHGNADEMNDNDHVEGIDGDEDEEEGGRMSDDEGDDSLEPAEITAESEPNSKEDALEAIPKEEVSEERFDKGNSGRYYNLRPHQGRRYSHMYGDNWDEGATLMQLATLLKEENIQDVFHNIAGYIMTQMTATAGIKKHGDAAIDALFRELAQLDKKRVFLPLDASSLTGKQKRLLSEPSISSRKKEMDC